MAMNSRVVMYLKTTNKLEPCTRKFFVEFLKLSKRYNFHEEVFQLLVALRQLVSLCLFNLCYKHSHAFQYQIPINHILKMIV